MMGTLLAGAFLALMTETLLNNALPTTMVDFHVSQATAQWLSTAYLLVVGLMIPVSAWAFSNFRSKYTFMAMMATFLAGSLVCILSCPAADRQNHPGRGRRVADAFYPERGAPAFPSG